jgi:FMN phosphatase YigB (HAD superfamily)
MKKVKAVILDYEGVFTLDDYSLVIDAFQKSSGLDKEEISKKIGEHERKWVLSPDSKQFLIDLRREFDFQGDTYEIAYLLNQRGNSGLYEEIHRFKECGLALAILSNQLAYRIPHVRQELETNFGLENFVRVWFSPEVGLQKPFVGVTEDTSFAMDILKVNIFPLVVNQMSYLGYSPDECVFVDDSQRNIQSAEAVGLNGIVFKNLEQMKKEFREKYGLGI